MTLAGDASSKAPVEAEAMSLPLFVCLMNVAAIVFLQRLVIPLGGSAAVSCLLPIAGGSLMLLLYQGAAIIDPVRLVAAFTFVTAAFFVNVASGSEFSLGSVSLLAVIYLLLPIRIVITAREYVDILRFFTGCAVVVAMLTFLQIGVQVVGFKMPILEWVLPDAIIVKNFNYLQQISWGSGLLKPNGIVMLEASFLSQFLALGLIIEYWVVGRPARQFLLAGALVLTFSGTGLFLATLVLVPMVIWRGVDRATLLLATAAVCVVLGLWASGYLTAIIGRVEEFSREDSSASLRFIAPVTRVIEFLQEPDITRVFLGFGAGFIDREIGFAWNPPVKVLVEYGLVVWMLYFVLLASLARALPSAAIAAALALLYLVLGGGALLQPPIVFACYFLGFGYVIAAGDSEYTSPASA